ncbi:MAG: porin, partial [Calditrichia bacterium]|nr:porin [Calditrichia bacterium]
MKFFLLICLNLFLLGTIQGYCLIPTEIDSSGSNKTPLQVKYGSKGWEFATSDGNYKLQFQSRLQFRFAHPVDTDPVTFDDFLKEEQNVFKVNRARLKIGGNAFQPWLKYYWEYELAAGNLLDFQMMVKKYSWFSIRVGQWKARYNRERVISSGKQQMVDRSLINRAFTLDRQQGISFYGHLKGKGIADFNYWLEILTGNGRGAGTNDDLHLMYVLRGQWNFLGRPLGFTGSDTRYLKQMAGLIALGATTNRSPYTRFSQAGGGQLEGFEPGEAGQYRVNQWMAESALMFKGFSWQQEFHWKQIDDNINRSITTIIGNYLQ